MTETDRYRSFSTRCWSRNVNSRRLRDGYWGLFESGWHSWSPFALNERRHPSRDSGQRIGDLLKSTRVSNRCLYATDALLPPYISSASSSFSEFFSKYLCLRSQPIFEVVTVFVASFLEKPIRTCSHYFFGQFKGAFVGFRG
jgi:hypothetical protein